MSKVIWTPKKYKETWLHVSQIENKKTIQAAYSMRSLDPEKAKKWVKQTDEGMKINVGYINEFNADVMRIFHTSHDVYYGLNYGYNMRDIDIAKYLSKHTDRTREAWTTYIARSLFMTPYDKNTMLRLGEMNIEFLYYTSRLLYKLLKDKEPVNNY
jgi:predicted patatin/cPLA2 family phospholipase